MTVSLTVPVQGKQNFWRKSLTTALWNSSAVTACWPLDGPTETLLFQSITVCCQQLEEFTSSFVQRLPKALESGSIATWLLFCELKYWFFKVQIPFLMWGVWVSHIIIPCHAISFTNTLRKNRGIITKSHFSHIQFQLVIKIFPCSGHDYNYHHIF